MRFTIAVERTRGSKWVFDIEAEDNAEVRRVVSTWKAREGVADVFFEPSPPSEEEIDFLARYEVLTVARLACRDLDVSWDSPERRGGDAVVEAIVATITPVLPEFSSTWGLSVTRDSTLGMNSYGLYGPNGTDNYIGHLGHRLWSDGDILGLRRAQAEQVAIIAARYPEALQLDYAEAVS